MSEDMSTYCSAHDEWLIMKLCMYVGYHDANNVSTVGGDPVTQLPFFKRFIVLFMLFYRHDAVTVSAAVATDHAQTTAVRRPYQPKHSPSLLKSNSKTNL